MEMSRTRWGTSDVADLEWIPAVGDVVEVGKAYEMTLDDTHGGYCEDEACGIYTLVRVCAGGTELGLMPGVVDGTTPMGRGGFYVTRSRCRRAR